MKNRKLIYVFLAFLSFCSYTLYGRENIDSLLKDVDISFNLLNDNEVVTCSIRANKGDITCNYGTDFIRLDCVESQVSNILDIKYVLAYFNLKGNPVYREYEFPKYYKISITENQIKKRIENKKYKNIYDSSEEFFHLTKAISICNNLRIRESPNTNSSTKVVGKLSKWQKVVLTECTKEKTKIENLEYPWYKVILEDGTEGWVFGGFVKIYFDDEELEMLHNAFEKEGSEYTNQFLTPDNS